MGKLSEYWEQLKTCNEADRPELQKKINGIEKWMIEKGIGSIKTTTDWSKKRSPKSAPALNPPSTALYGKDRCGACVYNHATYCNPEDRYGHMMSI